MLSRTKPIMKYFERFTFVTFLLLALIGLLFISIISHEFVHKKDLEDYTSNGYACLLVMPETVEDIFNPLRPTGYYSYEIDNEKISDEEVNNLREKTEFKAYSINIIIILIACLAIAYQFVERRLRIKN